MNNVIDSVDVIQNFIFDFNINPAMDRMSKMVEDLILLSTKMNVLSLNKLMGIINIMNIALGNKDYLLYSDLLEYELKPFLELEAIL